MRIYGSSPLYNYVELMFRCKRMFIISVILGTLLVSALVYSRATQFEARMLVALSGNPDVQAQMTPRDPNERSLSPAQRKARRLDMWIQLKPEFLEEVVTYTELDKRHPEMVKDGKLDGLIREVRKAITGPKVINDQYMEVSIVWPNQSEAESILNTIHSRFAEQTVLAETLTVSERRRILEKQFSKAETDSKEAARLRANYIKDNYWQLPGQLSSQMGQRDTIERNINDTNLVLVDARARLSEVDNQLKNTAPKIEESVGDTTTFAPQSDPKLALAAELDSLKRQRSEMLQTYSELHPKVQDLDKKIAATQKQLDEMKNVPLKPTETQQSRNVVVNTAWTELHSAKQQLAQLIKAQEHRLTNLNQQMERTNARLRSYPDKDVQFAYIENQFDLKDRLRRNMETLLVAAKLDEERDKFTQALEVRLEVKPRAEKVASSGRMALLYALGPLLGLFIAFCFSLLAETLDHTLRTPVEVEKHLGKPVLAVIPRMRPSREERKKIAGTGSSQPTITS